MKLIQGLSAVHPPLRNSILTIGNFDGVHLAHQALIAECRRLASIGGGDVTLLTFDPHPLSVVAPAKAPQPLIPLPEKISLFQEAGVDITVVARSELALLGLAAETFIEEVIQRLFQPAHIVEGPTFGFGKDRKGTAATLAAAASSFGCVVHIVPPLSISIEGNQSVLVSSSLIRGLLLKGQVAEAATCLGRNYALWGTVVRGLGRGRTIGFPTANVVPQQQVVPADGVYAGRAMIAEHTHDCAINIGKAPTFGDGARQIEAHLLDFDADLYDKTISLEFVSHLRDQKKFDSASALGTQIREDIEAVRTSNVPAIRPAVAKSPQTVDAS